MSISRRMDKKAVVHIHKGIYSAIKKNTFGSVLMRWMKLEPIIQSEVSQCRGPAPVDPGNSSGDGTSELDTIALIKY